MTRRITKDEERCYRLVSGDFEGLTQEQAAEEMGITQMAVSRLLAAVKDKAPQLFPLVTKQESEVWRLLREGKTDPEIMEIMNLNRRGLEKTIRRLRDKGRLEPVREVKMQSYDDHLADRVVRRF